MPGHTSMSNYERLKRCLDVAVSAGMLIELAPVFGLIALAIRVESEGPVFYRTRRMGKNRVPFDMYKFRSMRVSEGGDPITAPGDSRITRLGAWMRFFKIDELPQLWNVLVGDMSLVGPRAEDVDIVERYYTPEQLRVLDVPPGLTCIAQVEFFPDMTSQVPEGVDPMTYYREHQLGQKLDRDLEYADTASFWTDLALLVRTAYAILIKSWWILLVRPPGEIAQHDAETES